MAGNGFAGLLAVTGIGAVAAKYGLAGKIQGAIAGAGLNLDGRAQLTTQEAWELCKGVVSTYNLQVNPLQAAAICHIESSLKPTAYRYESHLDDASYGLMQVLWNTAKWLQNDLGYRGAGLSRGEDMYEPVKGVYIGCAYLDYLRRRFPSASEDDIARKYNGGPNGDNVSATKAYRDKYREARTLVIARVGLEGSRYA